MDSLRPSIPPFLVKPGKQSCNCSARFMPFRVLQKCLVEVFTLGIPTWYTIISSATWDILFCRSADGVTETRYARSISSFVLFCFICHIYPPLTRKRIVLLYFGREVRTRLGVAFFEVYGPPVFHIKVGRPVKCLAQGHNKRTCRLVLHKLP